MSVEYLRAAGVDQESLLGGGFKEDWGGVGIVLGGDKKSDLENRLCNHPFINSVNSS